MAVKYVLMTVGYFNNKSRKSSKNHRCADLYSLTSPGAKGQIITLQQCLFCTLKTSKVRHIYTKTRRDYYEMKRALQVASYSPHDHHLGRWKFIAGMMFLFMVKAF